MTGQQQRQAPAQQGQQGEVQRPKSSAVLVKEIISRDTCKKKFAEILGQKAPQFLASLTNVVSGSAQLKRADPNSIVSAAFVAATYDLPIDSNLGFAAIVPYNNNKYNPQTKKYEYHMVFILLSLRIVLVVVIRNDCRKSQVAVNRQIVCCRHKSRRYDRIRVCPFQLCAPRDYVR